VIGEHLLIIALLHWQAWDDATRDAWESAWDKAWEDYEREPAGRS
jgi:hypothetical protein